MDSNNPFHDHFSARAPGYAKYRPTYPRELADCLASLTFPHPTPEPKGSVWEAGCGSGQLTLILPDRFQHIFATDASADQLAQAPTHPSVVYRVSRAEQSGLEARSVDLAVAAQAAHWFDLNAYYREVKRVVRPGGAIALIVYGMHNTEGADVDRLIKHFYHETLREHWPAQRRLVEDEYQSLAFPFAPLSTPRMLMSARWSLPEMCGYVESWSATGLLIKAKGRGPVESFMDELSHAWGEASLKRTIEWPLVIRAGRI